MSARDYYSLDNENHMNTDHLISDLFASLRSRAEVHALLPLGFTPGIPVLTVENDYLCVTIPWLRYKVTGVADRTCVLPVRYTTTYVLPECSCIRFADWAYEPDFADTDFSRPCGLFRHEAIKDLDRDAYDELRARTLSGLDALCASLLEEAPFTADTEMQLEQDLRRIIEPSLRGQYSRMAPDFYNRYLND